MNVQKIAEYATANPEGFQKGREALQGILTRSATDQEFRRKLVSDPRAAVAEHTGRDVPEGFDVHFVENTATATIVLPDPIDARAELSESELEAVAGGLTPTVAVTLAFGGGVVLGAATYAIADVLT